MSELPSSELIQDIATELGVAAAFVEKDWHAVQALKLLADYSENETKVVFSGGTSLSKGYGLIQRFSEDIDFQVFTDGRIPKGARRRCRNDFVEAINQSAQMSVRDDSVITRNEYRFFRFDIVYDQLQELNPALRPHLQLEVSFKEKPIPVELRPIRSFVAQFTEQEAEANILCIPPAVTASDKFSALLWRILARDKNEPLNSPKNDPTIIRHLHDLAALETLAMEDQNFISNIHLNFEADAGRGGTERPTTLKGNIEQVLNVLEAELGEYESEYHSYVDAMSYAPDDERINFGSALTAFKRISVAAQDRLDHSE